MEKEIRFEIDGFAEADAFNAQMKYCRVYPNATIRNNKFTGMAYVLRHLETGMFLRQAYEVSAAATIVEYKGYLVHNREDGTFFNFPYPDDVLIPMGFEMVATPL